MRIMLRSENTTVWSINPSVCYIQVSLVVYYTLIHSVPVRRCVFFHISLLAFSWLNINLQQQSVCGHIICVYIYFFFSTESIALNLAVTRGKTKTSLVDDIYWSVCNFKRIYKQKSVHAPALIHYSQSYKVIYWTDKVFRWTWLSERNVRLFCYH